MDWMQFVSTLLGQLISWPVAVVAVIYILREPLKTLIPKLTSAKAPGVEANFGRELEAAEEKVVEAARTADETPPPPPPALPSNGEVGGKGTAVPEELNTVTRPARTRLDRYLLQYGGPGVSIASLERAVNNPRGAVKMAWGSFRATLQHLGNLYGAKGHGFEEVLNTLALGGVVSPSFVDAALALHDIRLEINQEVAMTDAVAFVQLAGALEHLALERYQRAVAGPSGAVAPPSTP